MAAAVAIDDVFEDGAGFDQHGIAVADDRRFASGWISRSAAAPASWVRAKPFRLYEANLHQPDDPPEREVDK